MLTPDRVRELQRITGYYKFFDSRGNTVMEWTKNNSFYSPAKRSIVNINTPISL